MLTPTGTWCEDAWLTAAALLAETERLKFLVAFRPGLVPPTLAAQQTATLQRFSEGRVLLNIVSGGDDVEQRRFGDWLGHDERYARTAEFLHVVNSVWRQDSVDFKGDYYDVQDARVSAPPDPFPEIYFGGSSPAALPVAAEYVDVYLTWGEPPQAAAAKIDQVRKLAQARGRNVDSGSGCTPSAATRRLLRGRSPMSWSANSPKTKWRKRLHCIRSRSRRGSAE